MPGKFGESNFSNVPIEVALWSFGNRGKVFTMNESPQSPALDTFNHFRETWQLMNATIFSPAAEEAMLARALEPR